MAREDPPPVPWVIEGLVVRGALTVLNGREGEGKSLLAMALGAGVVLGESQAGMTCHAGRVLIVDAENGEYETHRRVHALGLPGAAVFYEPEGGQRFDLRSDLGELDRLLVAHKPDLLVLDSFRTLWGGEENDSGDVAKVLDPLRNLVRKHQAGTLLLHHSGKANAGYRGSSAIGASAELGFTLARADGDEDRDRRSLTCWKCRPAPKPGKAWLRLSVERGMVLIDRAEPPAEGEDQAPKPVVTQLTAKILAAVTDHPATVAEIARRVGRGPKDGSVRNALAALQRSGDLEKTGQGWQRVQRCKPPGAAVAPLHPAETPHGERDSESAASKVQRCKPPRAVAPVHPAAPPPSDGTIGQPGSAEPDDIVWDFR